MDEKMEAHIVTCVSYLVTYSRLYIYWKLGPVFEDRHSGSSLLIINHQSLSLPTDVLASVSKNSVYVLMFPSNLKHNAHSNGCKIVLGEGTE